MEYWFPVVFCILGGLFTIGCAWSNYNWFMNHYKARWLVSLLGRTGARVFYVIVGLLLFLFGLALGLAGPPPPTP